MNSFLLVGVGGLFGALTRYTFWEYVPMNILAKVLVINMVGCMLTSFMFAFYGHDNPVTLFACVGFFASFTVIWRFIHEVVELWVYQSAAAALLYMVLMNLGCMLAVMLGRALAVRAML
ncbi:CrcB family protein [Candidatus Babeliales bacterium]|nr:CrcB family protein [Candidatus Babeliales bacterium]